MNNDAQTIRIAGRELAVELSTEDLKAISGGTETVSASNNPVTGEDTDTDTCWIDASGTPMCIFGPPKKILF